MADPIGTYTVEPPVASPGGSVLITVTASDPDNVTVSWTGTLTDQAGHTAAVNIQFPISDPITLDWGTPSRGTLNPQPSSSPNIFTAIWTDGV